MSDKTWMPVYWADYFLKTRRFRAVEHGVYLVLIAECWINDSFPDDDLEICQIACVDHKEWIKIKSKILSFFYLKDDVWRHDRVDHERKEAAIRYQKGRIRTAAATAARQRNDERNDE
jgi:uncharacterized protein YdaU (DUF1376 family)